MYRDDWLLVVDKPSGLPTQAPRGGGDNLLDHVRAAHGYAGLHHRLDTPASGLLALALDRRANRALAATFRERIAVRRYLVVVLGAPGGDGAWTTPIGGKGARTDWRTLASGAGLSVLEARLHTGRTHQVRVHAAGASHPVVGDRRHGGAAGRAWPRLALHAWKLELPHPRSGRPSAFGGPPPAAQAGVLARAGGGSESPASG